MISWSHTEGSVTPIGQLSGREIRVKGAKASGEGELSVDVPGLPLSPSPEDGDGSHRQPTIKFRHTAQLINVPARIMIVRDDDGNGGITIEAAKTCLKGASDILRQAGLTLDLERVPHEFIDKSDFLTVRRERGYPNSVQLLTAWDDSAANAPVGENIPDGYLEIYFVEDYVGAEACCFTQVLNPSTADNEEGIILEYDTPSRVAAHEILHACGARDIYISKEGKEITPLAALPKQEWCEDDWNNGLFSRSGYYSPLLKHVDFIRYRLIMSGDSGGTDIPLGQVHGVWYELVDGQRIYDASLPPDGLENLHLPPTNH